MPSPIPTTITSSFLRFPGPVLLGLVLFVAGCGNGDGDGNGVETRGAVRDRDSKLREAQEAVERGMVDVARTLLEQIGTAGVDGMLLEMRIHRLEGDEIAAMRILERAKETYGNDGRVWAAETELYATLGRLSGAEESCLEGLKRAGRTAELERAQGILLLSTPGGAELGLRNLERAIELDPALPYVGLPLAKARVLVGRAEVAREQYAEALAHARAALTWDAADPEARELLAEACTGLLAYEDALEIYAELEAEGHSYGATRAILHVQAATTYLLAKKREEAVAHYLAARALGHDDEGLGFGATILAQESEAAIDRGVAAYGDGDLTGARRAFDRALELDPRSMTAHNHLAVILFRTADYGGAARAWSIVLADSARTGSPLPEPVHLNLARAWHLAGETDKARNVLSNHLDRAPDGPWADDTRDLLFRLEEAALEKAAAEDG